MMDYFAYQDNFKRYADVESTLVFEQNCPEEPFLTIAIPTFRRATLLDTLVSVFTQTDLAGVEVVVVDNDAEQECPDLFLEFIKKYPQAPVRYYKNQKNIGMTGNWNRCIEAARGKWLTILHDDDLFLKSFVHDAKAILSENRQITMLLNAHRIEGNEAYNRTQRGPVFAYKALDKLKALRKKTKRMPANRFYFDICGVGSLGRIFLKENAVELGGFNEDFYPAIDYVFFAHYAYRYPQVLMNRVTACLVRYDENESLKRDTVIAIIASVDKFRTFLAGVYRIPSWFHAIYNRGRRCRSIKRTTAIAGMDIREVCDGLSFADELAGVIASLALSIVIFSD